MQWIELTLTLLANIGKLKQFKVMVRVGLALGLVRLVLRLVLGLLSAFWKQKVADTHRPPHWGHMLFERPFVKRYATRPLSVCLSVCQSYLYVCPVWNVAVLWPNDRMDHDVTWHAGRSRPYCVRWRPSSPSLKGAQPSIFCPISVVAKWLNGSSCHLVGR